ncbi:MAG: Ig-like domain-containing protein, partial [Verrucomicrobiota bacterium]
ANYTGSATGTLVIQRAEQSIDFAPLPVTPLKDISGGLIIEASATSRLPVTLTLMPGSAATLTGGNKLEGIAATGLVTLKATQTGNANYLAAEDVVMSLDVTKKNQVIDFPEIAATSADASTVNLRATASSGLEVGYVVVSGPATIAGSVLTFGGVGKVVVKAVQVGDEAFNAALPVQRSVTNSPVEQTITFPAVAGPTYGDAPITLAATSSAGLPVAYTVLRGAASVAGNRLTLTGAGELVVRASQAGTATIAAAKPVDQNIVVAQHGLQVAALSQVRVFGAANPAFGLTYQGFVNGDTATQLETAPVVSTAANETSAPGTYGLVPSGGRSANYRFDFTAGTLTITQAAQTLAFPALPSQALGNAPFSLGAVASSGLTPVYSIVSGPATLVGNLVTVTAAGTVVVQAIQPGNANFLAAAAQEQSFVVSDSIRIIGLTSSSRDGSYRAGQTITIEASFSGVVVVTGVPALGLNVGNGGGARYSAGSGSSTLSFTYVVQPGDNASLLDVAGTVPVGGTIASETGAVAPSLLLPAPGGVGSLSRSRLLRVDTSPPAAPTLTAVSPTNLVRPPLSGVTEPGVVVEVYEGAVLWARATAASNGAWTATGTAEFTAGSHSLSARATDTAGNVGPASPPLSIVVDTSVPAAPVILTSGASSVVRPVIRGSGAAGNTVQILDGLDVLDSVVAGADGAWVLNPRRDLTEGVHRLTATAINAAGTRSPVSAEVLLVIDLTAPAAPVITNRGVMAGTNATLTGTAEANSTVSVYDGTMLLGSAQAAATGEWVVRPTGSIASGVRSITATTRDAAGNLSPATAPVLLEIDPYAPDAPSLITKGSFNTAKPVISGKAEPLSTVRVFDGAALLGATQTSTAGEWTLALMTGLADGSHRITAMALDAAGNASGFSAANIVTIDATAPLAPVFEAEVFAESTPVVRGIAEPGTTVRLSKAGALMGSGVVDSGGFWHIKLSVALAEGVNPLSGVAIDAAGNSSPASAPVPISFNPVAPVVPVFASAFLSRSSNTPLIEGTAAVGNTVLLFDAGNALAEVPVGTDGKWSYRPTVPLSEGVHTLTARARSSGITSALSGPLELRIDTVAPVAASLTVQSPSRKATPTLTGFAEAGVTVKVYDGQALVAVTTSLANGNWSFSPLKAFAEGEHALTVILQDAAGNESARSAPTILVIDSTAPAAPVPAATAFFNLSRPVLRGQSEPLAKIQVSESGVLLGETSADSLGNWSIVPTVALGEGSRILAFAATDAAGNVGPAATLTVQIDLTAPGRPALVAPGMLRTLTPTLRGTAEAGAAVSVSVGAVVVASGFALADGTWSLTAERGLVAGEQTATAVATDAAGNRSAVSAGVQLVIDMTPPAAPQISTRGTFNVARPAVAGTAEALSAVLISEGTKVLGTALTDEAGQWSVVPAVPLNRGLHTLTAIAVDAAGNESTASASAALTINLVGPSPPVMLSAGPFNVGTPVIGGTAEPNTQVSLYEGAVLLGSAAAGPAGLWSITVGPVLTEGTHNLTAVATDQATGVAGSASEVVSVTIDFAPPARPAITPQAPTARKRPLIAGTAEPAATVVLQDGAAVIARVKAAVDGRWSFAPESDLAEGPHLLTAIAQDPAGNAGPASVVMTLIIDTIAPPAVVFRPLASPTNTASPLVGGTAEANATVKLWEGTQLAGTTTANASGDWSITVGTTLTDGAHTLAATATDAAGNTGPRAEISLVIDTLPPAVPTVWPLVTTSAVPVLRGTYDITDTAGL